MKDEKIYIVQGTTGEYSDRSEWNVCAYFDEELAKQHAELATAEAKRIENTTEEYDHEPDERALVFDPRMSIDYTGTNYTVVEVSIRTQIPTIEEQPHDK